MKAEGLHFLFEQRLRYMCFSVNFVEFLRALIIKNVYERLLLLFRLRYTIIDLDFIDAKKKIETDVSQCHYHGSIYSFFGFTKKFRIVTFLSYRHVTKSGRIYFIILLTIYIPGRNHHLIFRIFVFADKMNA